MKEGWSRDVLLNFMDSGLYEREGKALTNFTRTLPDEASDLAQELTKDPYNFAFTGITKPYNEQILKDALLANISHSCWNSVWICIRWQRIPTSDRTKGKIY